MNTAAQGTVVDAVDAAVALAHDLGQGIQAPDAAAVISALDIHLERWTSEFRPELSSAAAAIRSAQIGDLLGDAISHPERADPDTAAADAELDGLNELLQTAARDLGAWANDLAADVRGLGDVEAILQARISGETAAIDSARRQIADLQQQVADAEQRRQTEIDAVGWLFGLGYLIAELDDLIDNLVNQTDEKRRLADQLRSTLGTDEAELADLVNAQAAVVQMFDAGSAAAATAGGLTLQATAVDASLKEVREMIDDAAGLDPFLRAAADEWASLKDAGTRLAG